MEKIIQYRILLGILALIGAITISAFPTQLQADILMISAWIGLGFFVWKFLMDDIRKGFLSIVSKLDGDTNGQSKPTGLESTESNVEPIAKKGGTASNN